MKTNRLIETRTLEYKTFFFRAEIYQVDTGVIIQVGEYFTDVYLMMPVAPLGPLWRYLDDFPKELSTMLNTFIPKVMQNIQTYTDANASKLSAYSFKHW